MAVVAIKACGFFNDSPRVHERLLELIFSSLSLRAKGPSFSEGVIV